MSNVGGWVKTNKSKAEIARDKKKALEKRTRKRSSSGTKATTRNSKKVKHDYDDDDDSVDGFVAADDEVEYEDEEEEEDEFRSDMEDEDDDEEDVVTLNDDDEDDDIEEGLDDDDIEVGKTSASRSARLAARSQGKTSDNAVTIESSSDNQLEKNDYSQDDDNSSSPDSDEGTFFPNVKARPSKRSKLLQQNLDAAKGRRDPALTASKSIAKERQRRRREQMTTNQSSSLETLGTLTAPAIKKNGKQYGSKNSRSQHYIQKNDTDYSDEYITSPGTPSISIKNQNKKSIEDDGSRMKIPRKNKEVVDILSSDDEEEGDTKPAATVTTSKYFPSKISKQNDTIDLANDSGDDQRVASRSTSAFDDTPEPQSNNRRFRRISKKGKSKEHRNYGLDDSSDEDDIDLEIALKRSTGEQKLSEAEKRKIEETEGYDCLDSEKEDVEVAIQLSLKDQKVNGSVKHKKKKAPIYEDENGEAIEINSSDGEDDDQGGDYIDHEKEAATSVLKTAEQLSAQVISAMSSWFGKEVDDSEIVGANGSQGSAIQGIIVDGAVSLGNIEKVSANSNKEWISEGDMKKACPDVTLSKYQLIGVNWLNLLHGMKCKVGKKPTNVNGVLADEMGLGKTVQTIAFLAWLKYRRQLHVESDSEESLPHLIVVPVSTLPNWIREFEKFCPRMNVLKYHGTQDEREELKRELRHYHPMYQPASRQPKESLDVIVAPVTYFQKENSSDRRFLCGFKFDYLICDEAHNLKNAKSTRYKMLDRVKTEHRLLLTGTPIQNTPQELLNMLSFIMPLFSRAGESFEEKDIYTEQMLKYFVELEAGDDHERAYKKLKQLFAPFVLRRKKEEVISQLLPPKERITEFVTLDETARAIYESIIENHVNKNGDKIIAAIGDHLFTNLRKAAHHPLLLRTRHNTPEEVERLAHYFHQYGAFQGEGCTKERIKEELAKYSDFHIHLTACELIDENPHRRNDLKRYVLDEEDLFSSAKFVKLRSLLPKLVSEGHRMLIFSSWTSCLDLLGCLMDYLGLKSRRMDGSIVSEERQRLIDEFNSDDSISVFLLSTKACGLGINLTAADTCIIHDLDFNPFNDLQAEDRCHRIGQKKKVTVYKLVALDTVDADIYDMQEQKARMNAAIMEPSMVDRKDKREVLQSAVNRFLTSPQARKLSDSEFSNKENEPFDEVII